MPQIRRRIFVGCEGKGERSMTVVLQRHAEALKLPVHLDPYDTHGGDPTKIIEKSIKESNNRLVRRGNYDGGRFVLLDTDRISEEAVLMAQKEGIFIVKQIDCLESHLGKILSGKYKISPAQAKKELIKVWPEYHKGFDAPSLKSKMTIELVVKSVLIGEDWGVFLQTIGFIR